jgi:hypothetical protein
MERWFGLPGLLRGLGKKNRGCGSIDDDSRFRLFYKIGKWMFGGESGRQALDFALHRIGHAPPAAVAPFNPQLVFDLKKKITEQPF